MSWSPALPNLKFGTPLMANLYSYFKTNADAATTWANGNVALTPYVRIEQNARISKEHPSLAIVEARNNPVLDESKIATNMTQDFVIETVVSGSAPGLLLNELRTRVAANWQLLASITEAELMAGLTGAFTEPTVELGQVVFYGVRDPKTSGGLYEQTAFQSFSVTYMQVNQ